MKIELGLSSRFILKLNHWNIKNEKEKITQVFERAEKAINVKYIYLKLI